MCLEHQRLNNRLKYISTTTVNKQLYAWQNQMNILKRKTWPEWKTMILPNLWVGDAWVSWSKRLPRGGEVRGKTLDMPLLLSPVDETAAPPAWYRWEHPNPWTIVWGNHYWKNKLYYRYSLKDNWTVSLYYWRWSSYFGGLLVSQYLWVDSVQLQDEFIHRLCIKTSVRFQEPAVYSQLFMEALCHLQRI